MEKKLNKIKVIIPFYNPGQFIEMCINSVLTQDYENYEVLFIDDCSSDGSYDKIPACTFKTNADGKPELDSEGNYIIESKHPILEITKCKNVVAWRASERNTALPNIHNGIVNFCTDPDDIVVIWDGDDWAINKNTLSFINDFYNENDCWFSYGSAIWTDGRKCFSRPYTKENFSKIRKIPYQISHLRTWRAGVYHQIIKQDPELKCFKDKDGEWYRSCYDVPLCFALCEISGFDKVKHNSKPIYVYNRDNPISDDKVDQNLQTSIHIETSNKPSFKQVKDYITGELV